MLGLSYTRCKVTLKAVGAPNQRHGQQQLAFVGNIRKCLEALSGEDYSQICIAGDFNDHLSSLDVKVCRYRKTNPAQTLLNL